MPAPSVDHTIEIAAGPARVFAAFFDPGALAAWWRCSRSVTTPRPLGAYALEWEPTPFRDGVLGPLGGVLHGLVVEVRPGQGFFVANLYWLPPEGDPIGPMALDVSCGLVGARTRLHVVQRGFEEGARWRRYYEIVGPGFVDALGHLKRFIEEEEWTP